MKYFIIYITIKKRNYHGINAEIRIRKALEMDDLKANWTNIKEIVRREYNLSDISYHTWVEPLEFHNIENDVVNIMIPSHQADALNYISSKYKSFFQVTITEMFNHN